MKKVKSLFICGCCGKDTTNTGRDVAKVTLGGCANILCRVCRMCLDDDIRDLARKYLDRKFKAAAKPKETHGLELD